MMVFFIIVIDIEYNNHWLVDSKCSQYRRNDGRSKQQSRFCTVSIIVVQHFAVHLHHRFVGRISLRPLCV